MPLMHRLSITRETPPNAVAEYRISDKTLVVASPTSPRPELRVSMDTVTFFFSAQRMFVGIEAYTNLERWQHRELVLPQATLHGAVESEELFDENGIAPSSLGRVDFTYDDAKNVLKLELGGAVETMGRALSCALLGLDRDLQPVEVWLEALRFEE
jgi:hypothetical protein